MKYQFIPDKEIFLSPQDDLLKTKNYADTLKKVIANTISNEVFTIGLFGGWGSGKSSIIKTVRNEIERDNDKIKFITYDAWKYSNDSFRRMFLLKVQEELRIEQTTEMVRFYQSETADTDVKEKFSYTNLARFLFVLIVVTITLWLLPIELELKMPIYSILTIGSLTLAAYNGMFHKLKLSISKPMMFAPEQFEDCFKQMIDISLKKESWLIRNIKRLINFVRRGEATITNLEKLVIVIDNIDRCHSAMAYELLTDIKTFLSNEEYNIVFVVPVDDEALKKHLFNTTGRGTAECNRDNEEFLRKFFNITIRIKPHRPTEMLEFVHRLNDSRKLSLSNDTLSLISKEFARNPRRVIQLLNNLTAELSLYPSDFKETNELLICAILILKEEFGELYKSAIENTDAIKTYTLDNNQKEQNKFMSNVLRVFANANDSDIIKILTNSDEAFPEIPIEIKDSVASCDAQSVIKYANTNNNKNSIGRFIASRMQIDLKYYAPNVIVNWMEFIRKLNDDISFDRNIISSFESSFAAHYEKIISETNQYQILCKLSLIFVKSGNISLKEQIITYVEKISEDQVELFEKWFEAFVGTFKSELDCKRVASLSEKYYAKQYINQKLEYSDAQLMYLFNDSVFKISVENLDNLERDDQYSEVLWLCNNKPNISNDLYIALFTKIDLLLGNMRAKTKEEILSCIEFVTPLLCTMKATGAAKDELQVLYTKIFNSRGIPNPSYPTRAANDKQIKFIDEIVAEKTHINQIIDFYIEIYRTSRGQIDIKNELMAMRDIAIDSINSRLVEFLSKNNGFTLYPLYTVIILDENYDNANCIKLIHNCFKHRNKDTNKLYLSETQITSKVKSLIDNVASNTNVSSLIFELSQDVDVKGYIINEITSRESAFINSLPEQLLTLAVGAFSKNTKDDFSNNYDYLGVIADRGAANQKNSLVDLLCHNIYECSDIESRLTIFERLPKLSNGHKNGSIISGLDNYLSDNGIDMESDIAKRIKGIIEKFS